MVLPVPYAYEIAAVVCKLNILMSDLKSQARYQNNEFEREHYNEN